MAQIVYPRTLVPLEPPMTLGAAGRRLWGQVQRELRVHNDHAIKLATEACEAADRLEELARLIAEGDAMIAVWRSVKSQELLARARRTERAIQAYIEWTLALLDTLEGPPEPVNQLEAKRPSDMRLH